jgi:hypothetical protein
MHVGMILKEAGYCTGNIKKSINISIADHINGLLYIPITEFWIKKYDFLKVNADVKVQDIVVIWEI